MPPPCESTEGAGFIAIPISSDVPLPGKQRWIVLQSWKSINYSEKSWVGSPWAAVFSPLYHLSLVRMMGLPRAVGLLDVSNFFALRIRALVPMYLVRAAHAFAALGSIDRREKVSQDINDARPSSLAHMVGQQAVVDQLRVALDASFQDGKRLDDCLLVGPPGVGKSQIASILAQELATNCHEALGQSIKSNADLHALLLGAKDGEVVFIDECHELQRVFQTALYLALDKRRVVVCGSKAVQSIPIADFTLLLGTTDEFCLLQPLRDRMKLVLRFGFYSVKELTRIVRHRTKALGWPVEDVVFSMIGQRARGTPRLALRLLQSCRRVCRAEGEQIIMLDHLRKACLLEGLDELGLGPTEQQYLGALADGASRLNVIASMLGLPSRTVAEVTEPFLIRAGLVVKDDQGRRQLTAQGREHLMKSCGVAVQFEEK